MIDMRSGRDEILAKLRRGKSLIFVHQEPGLLSTAFEVVDHLRLNVNRNHPHRRPHEARKFQREVNPCTVQVRALSCLRRHKGARTS